MENINCSKCSKPADSPMAYKCDVCSAESETHDPSHECGEAHCVVKCSECKMSETQCPCS
ncbi:MAG: hypothetical protein UR31_C0026G0008 [Parcubacteria group bacterium GW2011_GWA2_33_14]|nr:MAG: hypothetical protein UR31_C0026G0008 [Parcubacteria group bacterium GW2011_GWA2_33_14]